MRFVQPVVSYIGHLFRATNAHGIHSPFVFELLTQVLRGNATIAECADIEKLRKARKAEKRTIEITDLGAGSRNGFLGNRRSIGSIASSAAHPKKDCALLYRLATHFKANTILELGTSLGISTAYLARACPHAQISTIEGCSNIHREALETFSTLGITHINALNGPFSGVLEQELKRLKKLDFLYVDGDHRSGPTLEYIKTALPYLHEGSVVVFDDIHWNRDMERAWESIKALPELNVTLDLYQFGLAFIRPGQVEQHFRIRL